MRHVEDSSGSFDKIPNNFAGFIRVASDAAGTIAGGLKYEYTDPTNTNIRGMSIYTGIPVAAAWAATDSGGTVPPVSIPSCLLCHENRSARVNCRNKSWLSHLRKRFVDSATFDLAEKTYLGAACRATMPDYSGNLKNRTRK